MKKLMKRYLFKHFLMFLRLRSKLKAKLISDKKYVNDKFIRNFGVLPDLQNPQRYNEHISKILLTQPGPLTKQCVDKYEVRQYVRDKVGGHILNDLYGIYTNTKELKEDWATLPRQFVLKAKHGCGWNYLCKDKDRVDFKHIKTLFDHWMKSNFYYAQREHVYKELMPGILAEKYLQDESGGLIDYKIHCFNGEPRFINVIYDRFTNMRLNTYDMDWNFVDIDFDDHYPTDPNLKIEKPERLDKIIEYSKQLSWDFKYVRVDFYIVDGKIYFGELTFTPGNGAYTSFTKEDDSYFGSFFKQGKQ